MLYEHIVIKTNDISPFSFILQEGFGITIKSGSTLKQLLCDQCNIPSDYIDRRIKTAFLNQKPVDNFDTVIVNDQDSLGLSGAMPGLVGAIFRKNSVLSVFRRNISYSYSGISNKTDIKDGVLTVKLFNFLIKEIGATFFEKGVLIQSESLKKVIETERFRKKTALNTILVNGQKQNWRSDSFFLNIKSDQTVLLMIERKECTQNE